MTMTEVYPDIAIPLGEYLAEEIQARNISQKELAKHMGQPLNTSNEIITGRRRLLLSARLLQVIS